MNLRKPIVCFLSLLFCICIFSGCSPSASTSTSLQVGESTSIQDLNITLLETQSAAFVDGYEPAPYGQEFFFVALEVENVSKQDKDVSGADFKFYVDNQEVDQTVFLTYQYSNLDNLYSTQKVAAGRKASFYLVATVPENCESVDLTYQDDYTLTISHTPNTSSQESLSSSKNTDLSAGSSAAPTPPTFSVGETFSNSSFDITLSQAIQTDYVGSNFGSLYYAPNEGKHFVIFVLDIKNTSAETSSFNYLSHFSAYADDYATQFTTFLSADFDGYTSLSDLQYTDILPDKSIVGYCALEVPDGWSSIELSARNGTFTISSDDVQTQ